MIADARQFLEVLFLAVAGILPIVNPLAVAPVFLAKTADLTTDERRSVASRVAHYGFALLLASALVGAYVLDFFGISIPVVQVAGGIVVGAIGWKLLWQDEVAVQTVRDAAEAYTPDDLGSRAFYPLTMPLTVGPGSISVAITLGANPSGGVRTLVVTQAAHAVGFAIVAVAIYYVYAKADVVLERLGRTGAVIVARLSAFILLCIGVQIVWNGVRALIATV
ncbi:MAG: NAAT family transporter [Burkholderiales bacterium]|nr:NAAT family transporter [Burkholderiales bacterium]